VKALKIVSIVVGMSALAVLAFFGFAVWVFLPLLPAAILVLIALISGKRSATITDKPKETEAKPESRKAA
jgi:hypothetical protein